MTARPLKHLSPTRLADLLACPLRVKHALETATATPSAATTASRSPHAEMGDVCHAVLEKLADANDLANPDAFENAWHTAVTVASNADTQSGDLAAHPQLPLTKLRLQRAIARLVALLEAAPGALVPEEKLSSRDGRLNGRPDLIVRGPDPWIVDLKTGRIRPTPDAPVNPDYENQLQLYAYLEHQTTGTWPTHAWLITLQGRDQRFDIDPEASTGIANHALDALDNFNDQYPDIIASPSANHCHWCSHLSRCTEPWRPDTDWQETFTALLRVTGTRHGSGDAWLHGDVLAGTVDADALAIRRIDTEQHPAAAEVNEGDTVAVIGLRRDHYTETWALRPTSRLEVLRP